MDLTKTFPRSVWSKFAGLYMLGRTTDKARALNAGSLGPYHYDCPMDKEAFAFLGTHHGTYAKKVAELKDDTAIAGWVRSAFLDHKSAAEIDAFNRSWYEYGPDPGTDGEVHFVETRAKLAPNRTDITIWPDLLDLDEHREVPVRAA
jgi:hypothetical protein